MDSNYGFVITAAGRELLATLLAGERLEITRVMVGEGRLGPDDNPANLTDLIAPVAQGTTTVPVVANNSTSFVVEYRSDLGGGLERPFWLNEFGVFALDKEGAEIMLYYAALGDYPQYVSAYDSGAIDIRRFPVTIAVSTDAEVILGYPAEAFMTSEEIGEYVMSTLLPRLLEREEDLIKKHNADPQAHPDLIKSTNQISARVTKLEDMLNNDVTRNSYTVSFVDLEGVTVKGVWNRSMSRIEF